jgi:uncharacterized protein
VTVLVRPLRAEDAPALGELLQATGVFTPVEVETAMKDIEGGSDETSSHGYRFRVADDDGAVLGFTCFGRAWFTEATWDVYWLAVDPSRQRQGVVGAMLLAAAEAAAVAENGRLMLVETSSKPPYEPSRRFYERSGYVEVARVPDFYAEGDDKVVYAKRLGDLEPFDPAVPAGVRVAESDGRGRGVFALRAFKAGETIERAPVIPFPAAQWKLMEATVLDDFCFAWGEGNEDGAVGLGFASIYNHSFTPNARYIPRLAELHLEYVAIRDIQPGEEITTNYNRDPESGEPVWFDPV